MKEPYRDERGFRTGVGAQLKNAAQKAGRDPNEIRREFLFQRFLTRLFAKPGQPWVVKGGTNLLIRLPRARFSQDIDLLYRGDAADDTSDLVAELRDLTRHGTASDFITFEISDPGEITGQADEQVGAKAKVTGYVGTVTFGTFPIDLSMKLRPIARTDMVRLTPIIDLPGDPTPVQVALYPLPDQIADKVCAMYGTYRATKEASSRFHDLVDLALIVTTSSFPGADTDFALHQEAARRPGLELPDRMVSPGQAWLRGYRDVARRTSLPNHLHDLEEALSAVGRCLNPVLARQVVGTWDPATASWLP